MSRSRSGRSAGFRLWHEEDFTRVWILHLLSGGIAGDINVAAVLVVRTKDIARFARDRFGIRQLLVVCPLSGSHSRCSGGIRLGGSCVCGSVFLGHLFRRRLGCIFRRRLWFSLRRSAGNTGLRLTGRSRIHRWRLSRISLRLRRLRPRASRRIGDVGRLGRGRRGRNRLVVFIHTQLTADVSVRRVEHPESGDRGIMRRSAGTQYRQRDQRNQRRTFHMALINSGLKTALRGKTSGRSWANPNFVLPAPNAADSPTARHSAPLRAHSALPIFP